MRLSPKLDGHRVRGSLLLPKQTVRGTPQIGGRECFRVSSWTSPCDKKDSELLRVRQNHLEVSCERQKMLITAAPLGTASELRYATNLYPRRGIGLKVVTVLRVHSL